MMSTKTVSEQLTCPLCGEPSSECISLYRPGGPHRPVLCASCKNEHPEACPRCGGESSSVEVRGHTMRVVCVECSQADKEALREFYAESERMEMEARWKHICPPLYRQTDPARLPQDKLSQVMSWSYGPGGLMLLGPTDTGKTRCAFLLLRRLLEQGRSIRAYDCVGFGHECARQFSWKGSFGDGAEWIEWLVGLDVLFFDDLGKGVFTERVESELFGLIEKRVANLRPIVVTTNMIGRTMADKLSADRSAPLIRRLREFCKVVTFTKD